MFGERERKMLMATPQRLGISKGGASIKAVVSDPFAVIEFCRIPTDPPNPLCLSVFHYCGRLWMYYCTDTKRCHQNIKIVNAKKELGQSWNEIIRTCEGEKKRTLKTVSLQLISWLTRKGDLLIQRQYSENHFGLFLLIVLEQWLYCSGISSIRVNQLGLQIPEVRIVLA